MIASGKIMICGANLGEYFNSCIKNVYLLLI